MKKLINKNSLSKKLPILGINDNRIPIIYFRIIFNNGGIYDNNNKKGLSYLLTQMLLKGNKKIPQKKLNLKLDKLGATLSLSAKNDYIILFGRVLKENFNQLILIVKDIFDNPIFSQEEFLIYKSKANDLLLNIKDKNNYLATYLFSKILYKNDTYSYLYTGTEKTIKNITLDDLYIKFRELKKNKFTFLITGDYSNQNIKFIENNLNVNNENVKKSYKRIKHHKPKGYELYYYNKVGNEINILVGDSSISINNDNIYSLLLFNKYFGGDFTSLLVQDLREEKGWTYHTSSSYNLEKFSSSYTFEYSVNKENLLKSLSYTKNLFLNATKNIDNIDFEFTKSKIKNSFYFRFATTINKLNILTDMIIYNYNENFYDNYLKKIDITKDILIKNLNLILNPLNQIVILVGEVEEQIEQINKLNIFSKITKLDKL